MTIPGAISILARSPTKPSTRPMMPDESMTLSPTEICLFDCMLALATLVAAGRIRNM